MPSADDLVCPTCKDDDHLSGTAVDGIIEISCDRCGLAWQRDLAPRCPTCGSGDVVQAAQAVREKSRGTHLSITSIKVVLLCPTCDPARLRRWWDSRTPPPPKENPAAGMR
jgi:hypothetical protein